MKNKIIILLMMFLSLQVNAQQRKKIVTQRRTTTSVKKSNPQTIKKTREVGEDGFIWYKLRKGNLYGAADIDGKTIIPIKYTMLYYSCSDNETHYFKVKNGDYHGVYTRRGRCLISPDKHFTNVTVDKTENNGNVFLYVTCKNNFGEKGLYDIRGNEVIAPGNYENLYIMAFSDNDDIAFIRYKKGGLIGAYDLNGNLLIMS